jgi:hypothetical protein
MYEYICMYTVWAVRIYIYAHAYHYSRDAAKDIHTVQYVYREEDN